MNTNTLATTAGLLLLAGAGAHGQTIIADNYDTTGSGTGFGLGSGVNSGINPPVTRLTGSEANNLRYIATDATKVATSYSITGNKLQVAAAANSGRFALSADGTAAFNFSSALGIGMATAANPVVYDIAISMANNAAGTQRFSFALGTADNNANFWDFGVQLHRSALANNFYTIQKRIDQVSYTTATDSTGSTGDLNAAITTTAAGTYGSQLNFLMRVTDAGAEASSFNSRLQLSLDGGSSWFYDTQTDAALALGWRLDGGDRYFMWDVAAQAAATYDDFSVTIVTPAVPEPSAAALGLIGGIAILVMRRRR